MRKLLKYKNGSLQVMGGMLEILPATDPVEEYDLSELNDEEIENIRRNPNSKKYKNKIKKIKNG